MMIQELNISFIYMFIYFCMFTSDSNFNCYQWEDSAISLRNSCKRIYTINIAILMTKGLHGKLNLELFDLNLSMFLFLSM